MVGQSDCPPSALSTIHTCASRGEDQQECCERAGIPTLCVRYCNPSATPMNTTSRFPCLLYLDKMKECFFKKSTDELEKFEPPIQCLNSGVCGGNGGYCAPPAPLPCQPSSCQPGYTCGQYGCARNRARSALTKKISGIFVDDQSTTPLPKKSDDGSRERNIYGLSRGVTRPPPTFTSAEREQGDNVTINKLTNPNFIFRQCCEQRGLPDSCLNKCHFNTYTRDALQAMYFKTDPCPIEATADMHFCAAQGRDHRECCRRNGVTTTLAGEKCLTFCDQRPDRITKLDYSYVPCYDRFEQMKQCFYNEIREKVSRQFGTR
ncbi:unnamed protein product [Cylicocyclus nassatus]|uniref:Domain of unknown function DB domain-containing protein n=1 Tax=Cylicocyclus nassatus TaxID=53992 RepID=A0AA36GUQ4_CYLNA|nr:unnamed protein product [Cylicocyclus nassatus]